MTEIISFVAVEDIKEISEALTRLAIHCIEFIEACISAPKSLEDDDISPLQLIELSSSMRTLCTFLCHFLRNPLLKKELSQGRVNIDSFSVLEIMVVSLHVHNCRQNLVFGAAISESALLQICVDIESFAPLPPAMVNFIYALSEELNSETVWINSTAADSLMQVLYNLVSYENSSSGSGSINHSVLGFKLFAEACLPLNHCFQALIGDDDGGNGSNVVNSNTLVLLISRFVVGDFASIISLNSEAWYFHFVSLLEACLRNRFVLEAILTHLKSYEALYGLAEGGRETLEMKKLELIQEGTDETIELRCAVLDKYYGVYGNAR